MTQQVQSAELYGATQNAQTCQKSWISKKKTGKWAEEGNQARVLIGCLTSANRPPPKQLRRGASGPNGRKGDDIVIRAHLCILVGYTPSWTTVMQTRTNAAGWRVGCDVLVCLCAGVQQKIGCRVATEARIPQWEVVWSQSVLDWIPLTCPASVIPESASDTGCTLAVGFGEV